MPGTGHGTGLVAPAYDVPGLRAVLPSVAASLGVAELPPGPLFRFPAARSAVVVLVDGLGFDLLSRRRGHAAWLRSMLPAADRVTSGFPSTTATSMGSFGTGLAPGAHGMLGYEVLVPGEDRLLNELSWEDGPVPERWQPHPTVFELAVRAGLEVTKVGPGFFAGSGLTRAALRGGSFLAADTLGDRVDATVSAVRAGPPALVYLYWGDLDKAGHVHGCESWEWGEQLEGLDRELARLAGRLPAGTSLTITADHGMIDSPHEDRLDVGGDPVLASGVRHVGGEPRAPQLYCEPGAAGEVLTRWTERLGERAVVRSRAEAVSAGLFGAVTPSSQPRIGDVVVVMRDRYAVVDSRHHRPKLLALRGLHGSLTEGELWVPVIHLPGGEPGPGEDAGRG